MAHFLFEAKKTKKKKSSKKKKKKSYYYGTNYAGFPWMGRASAYPHMPPPPPPGSFSPAPSAPSGPSGDCGCCGGLGESETHRFFSDDLDEQVINIYSFDQNGNRLGKRSDFFNPVKFKKALEDGIVRFIYTKVNGTQREAYGTTNINILRNNKVTDLRDKNRPRNSKNIRYYDMQRQGWRSFRPESLKSIYERVTIEAI